MATQGELVADLKKIADQVTKIRLETIKRIGDLENALTAAGKTTPEVDAALAALKGTVQAADDVTPDPTT